MKRLMPVLVLTVAVLTWPSSPAAAGSTTANQILRSDFDGDGFDDLAVGVPYEKIGGAHDAGAVNVIYGSSTGLVGGGDEFWHQDRTDVAGDAEESDNFGSAVASGDFDNDGFDDLVVGVPDETIDGLIGAGGVHVFYGRSGGLSAADDRFFAQDTGALTGSPEVADRFGYTVATADFGGDGFDDIAVAVRNEEVSGGEGAVQILYGSAAGVRDFGDDLFSAGDGEIAGSPDRLEAGNFGKSPLADLAVGVPRKRVEGADNAGAVDVLYGRSSGLSSQGKQRLSQAGDVIGSPEENDAFGDALGPGNFDGDSFDDLAIGAPSESFAGMENAGGVHVLYGSSTGITTAGQDFWTQEGDIEGAPEEDDHFGWALVAGRFNDANRADLAIGVPLESIDAQGDGAVNVLYGSPSGLTVINDLWSQGAGQVEGAPEDHDFFGFDLTAGDYSGGRDDLAVGVPLEDVDFTNDGGVNVLYGSSVALTDASDDFWHQGLLAIADDTEAYDCFGEFRVGAGVFCD